MKRGAKRGAISDPPSSASDLPSKRVMDGPSFDVRRAESSHQHLMAGPAALDPRRAEAARQHVRALNNQFASWVQAQLEGHLDELWEDGVKDYLSHTSQIMEKFKDVVDWLRTHGVASEVSTCSSLRDPETIVALPENNKAVSQSNTSSGQTDPTLSTGFSALQNTSSQNMFSFSLGPRPTFAGASNDNKNTLVDSNTPTLQFGLNNGFSRQTVPTIFSTSSMQSSAVQSSSHFPAHQPPAFPGKQSSAEASGDADEENELEQPSSPSVKKTEEKGIVVVHEAKCKVYVKHDDASKGWKDIGVGLLSIRCTEGAKKASKESKPTVVIRNDVGKILLNALIYAGIKMNVQKNTVASIFHTSDSGQSSETGSGTVVARTYLLRLKSVEAATNLAAVIRENAPSD